MDYSWPFMLNKEDNQHNKDNDFIQLNINILSLLYLFRYMFEGGCP